MPLTDAQLAFINKYIAGYVPDLGAIPIEGTEEDQKLITALRALADKVQRAIDANPALNYGVRDLITAVRRDHSDQAGLDARVRALGELDAVCTEALATRKRVSDAFAGIRDAALAKPPELSEAQKTAILDLVAAQEATLAPNLANADAVIAGLKVARDLRQFLDDTIPPLVTALDPLTGAPDGALTREVKGLADLATAARDAIGRVIAATDAAGAAGAIEAVRGERQRIAAQVARRAAAATELGGPDLQKAADALGADRLTDLVDAIRPPVKAVLDGSKVPLGDLAATIDDVFGGDVGLFADVLENGFGGDADRLKGFVDAFPDGSEERAELGDLVRDGGFADAPGALSAVFAIGCDGDPAKLAALADDFKDKGDRDNLAGLIGKGGLGEAPEALAHVFRTAGSAKAKELGKAFQSDTDLKKLDDMVTRGGLGGASARSPDALASILTDGVDEPGDLKGYYDGFQTGGMDDFRAMIAAFDLAPPPSDAGRQFRTVTGKVCPPPSDLRDVYVASINDGARGSLARTMSGRVAARAEVSDALAAVAAARTPATEAGLAATYGAAAALEAVDGVPGIDATALAALRKATEEVSAATAMMADVAALRADTEAGAKAKAAGETADAGARKAATDAAAALATAAPPTEALITAARETAQKALAAARLTEDDTARTALLDAAAAGFDAISRATAALSADVTNGAITETARESGARAAASKAQAQVTAPLADTMFARQKALTDAPPPRDDYEVLLADVVKAKAALSGAPPPPATPQADYEKLEQAVTAAEQARDTAPPATSKADYAALQQAVAAAEQARAAAAPARDAAIGAMKDAAARASQSTLAQLALTDPAILSAQAEAARLAGIASAPGATVADHLAAADAAGAAAKLLAAAAAAPLGPNAMPTGIVSPNKGAPTIMTVTTNDAGELYRAAIALDTAMTTALDRFERATDAYRLQERAAAAAQETAALAKATGPEKTAAADAADALNDRADEVTAARDALDKLAKQARKLDGAVQKNVLVHKLRLDAATPTTTPTEAAQQAIYDELQDTVAICALITKRAFSVTYPPMSRDDLFRFSSQMKKTDTSAMSEHEVIDATNFPGCTVDTQHFCGRHTTEHFGFEGRDFYPEDELLDAAIIEALNGGDGPRFPMNMMKTTSLWPFDFGEADIKACLKLALAEVKANKTGGSDIWDHMDANGESRMNFNDITISYNSETYKVQIGIDIGATPNTYHVGQFFPRSTPSVPFFDMHAIKSATKH